MIKFIKFLIIVGLLAALGAGYYFYDYATTPANLEGKSISYVVQPGSLSRIAQELELEGVLNNARLFVLYAKILGKANKVKVGEYKISAQDTPQKILETLISGKSMAYPVTFQEGINVYEVAQILEKRGFVKQEVFLALVFNRKLTQELLGESLESFEGYLFPNTYLFTRFTGAKGILQEMVRQFLDNYKEVVAEGNNLTMKRHEHVTLASIIEKETGVPEERNLVSSVFHNRLKIKMMLQTDPTVIYGIWVNKGEAPQNIRKSDLTTPTKYNTYTFKGLPPGPIANPGRESLKAALNPAESEYLFFVSQNDGTHVFSENYKKHDDAVKRFQVDRKAREGKSWRDYKRVPGPSSGSGSPKKAN